MMKIMQDNSTHRGMRQTTMEMPNDIWFGHTRLPIQGLDSKWDQPIATAEGNYMGVGEFFNFRELPGEKEAENDFDVFIRWYEKMGDRAWRLFDGFWSFVAYNRRLQEVFVYTDFLAKKPLYYTTVYPDVFAISSGIIPLRKIREKVSADELYFSAVAKWGYCPENRTPFKEIQKIPANTCCSVKPGFTPSVYQYSEPLNPIPKPFKQHIIKAVERRLISDIPVALLCSGGLDSTIIYKLVQQFTEDYHVFTVPNGTDAEYIDYLDIPSDKRTDLELRSDREDSRMMIWNESPVDLGSCHPQLALSDAIWKEGYNVVLSGDGADELFGGYGRARKYDSQYSDIFHELVFYHLPRLDKLMSANTIELRSPFLARPVIEGALSVVRAQRTEKQYLKNMFKDIVPEPILNRPKEPLKIPELRYEPMKYRLELIEKFRKEYKI